MPFSGKTYKALVDEARAAFKTVEVQEKFLNNFDNWQWGDPVFAEAVLIVRTQDDTKLTYVGSGDSTLENASNVGEHYPRMALTRAKARAYKEALGEGEAAAEEFSGSESSGSSGSRTGQSRGSGSNGSRKQKTDDGEDRSQLPATKKQMNYLESLISDKFDDESEFEDEFEGYDLDNITREEASTLIKELSER